MPRPLTPKTTKFTYTDENRGKCQKEFCEPNLSSIWSTPPGPRNIDALPTGACSESSSYGLTDPSETDPR